MIVRVVQRLMLWTAPAVRRGVAVACAVAFVLVSVGHSVHDFNRLAPTAVVQADLGSFDDAPDTSKKAPVTIEHCHGCSMIAMAVPPASIAPRLIATDLPATGFDEKRPHVPVAETPPPIFLI